ncbi:hypothetical protein IG193_06530 [Infirmifilum lucidum]|uniref:Uncharacterized protein n=1 Tax=Infirmifilum lucidum TaxID=2776706 RepID=A0A7L9FHL4_9CREN|nr:hypothetical protein [Infirmifilum lucidum]QOJ78406.1 hypothetical protein IG193_06530 [Infirmifilum lucidum]
MELSVVFNGKEYRVVYGCLKSVDAGEFQAAVDWARRNAGSDPWLVLLRDCCKIPDKRVIVSSLLHSLRNYSSGKMISKNLVHELLIFILGVRNIREATEFFASGEGENIGYICMSSRGRDYVLNTLEVFKKELGLVEEGFNEDCWVERYSAYLGVPPERELLVRVLRARATLLTLTL